MQPLTVHGKMQAKQENEHDAGHRGKVFSGALLLQEPDPDEIVGSAISNFPISPFFSPNAGPNSKFSV